MTLKDLYQAEREKDKLAITNANLFIRNIAEIACCSEATVRVWLVGKQKPDTLRQKLLSEHYGIPVDQLFNYPAS